MFSTNVNLNGVTRKVSIRFSRVEADETSCIIKIMNPGQNPKDIEDFCIGYAYRNSKDNFDKVKGQLLSMQRALKMAGFYETGNKDVKVARIEIIKEYAQWALKNNIRTKVPVSRILSDH
jgi:hypothetical protein